MLAKPPARQTARRRDVLVHPGATSEDLAVRALRDSHFDVGGVNSKRAERCYQHQPGPDHNRPMEGPMMADSKPICSIHGCCNPARHRGWCNAHYLRWRRHGDPLAGASFRGATKAIDGSPLVCRISGCEGPVEKKGLCVRHYHRNKRHGDPEAGRASAQQIREWVDVLLSDPPDECVIWPFGTQGHGYGAWTLDGRGMPASRAVLILATGEPPEGMYARHGPCHDRRCVNPRHLSWGTNEENVRDRIRDRTNSKKLTREDVVEIRTSSEPGLAIASRYQISASQVSRIRLGRAWRGV